ncbi:unnamed protein product [Staurois parvus]|uniref:Solute carrier family 40 protein n=1 Tax=Staurois parvus TaxID=386267 RepID=A0ABN9BSC4_9NEOB|nr:unnamed protein product [Staurois parvus]
MGEEFVGCLSGFASTSGRILGDLWAFVRILGGCGTILVLATSTSLILHLWDSPHHQVILQCWYVKDQDVLGHLCSLVHQKVAQH